MNLTRSVKILLDRLFSIYYIHFLTPKIVFGGSYRVPDYKPINNKNYFGRFDFDNANIILKMSTNVVYIHVYFALKF